ncbi:unnamed protein product [Arabis nemorensis]|uniref:Phytocyanin domain-containing protein n=1 Tax=Arabis nemorensis TaxID=586526 RepID=A0A565BZ61_9BRAS|nr:unnamed protein product [Arabis nemorensis]
MATTKKMIFCFMLVIFMVLLSWCSATVYKVGDSDGWTAKDDVYYDWAYPKEFHVGDSLVFEYDPNFNDVTQVSGAFSNHAQCVSGQKLDVLVVHDPSRPVPPPPINNDLPLGKFYKVGDSKGWNVYDGDFLQQVERGETVSCWRLSLFFEYNNDVLEISGDLEFISCDPTSPVSVHKTGHDLVRLTKPGVHYFISSETGHCYAGLKLRVVVGPLIKDGTVPDFTKKMELSPMDRLNKWLRSFGAEPRH